MHTGLGGVRKPGGVGRATRCMGGGWTTGEAGEDLRFLEGGGEDMADVGVQTWTKTKAYIDPFFYFLFQIFFKDPVSIVY